MHANKHKNLRNDLRRFLCFENSKKIFRMTLQFFWTMFTLQKSMTFRLLPKAL